MLSRVKENRFFRSWTWENEILHKWYNRYYYLSVPFITTATGFLMYSLFFTDGENDLAMGGISFLLPGLMFYGMAFVVRQTELILRGKYKDWLYR